MKATFKLKKDCKYSRRYECKNDDFPIRDVYVMRPWSDGKSEITVEVEDKGPGKS